MLKLKYVYFVFIKRDPIAGADKFILHTALVDGGSGNCDSEANEPNNELQYIERVENNLI